MIWFFAFLIDFSSLTGREIVKADSSKLLAHVTRSRKWIQKFLNRAENRNYTLAVSIGTINRDSLLFLKKTAKINIIIHFLHMQKNGEKHSNRKLMIRHLTANRCISIE